MAPDRILIAGGGIGGLAAALALAQKGIASQVLEKANRLGEIGAGIQLGPNAFHCFDHLGVGAAARGMAVYIDQLRLMDALADGEICHIDLGDKFRARFGNPYAVIHRADIHLSIYEEVQTKPNVRLHTSTKIDHVDIGDKSVRVTDTNGNVFEGAALIGCERHIGK